MSPEGGGEVVGRPLGKPLLLEEPPQEKLREDPVGHPVQKLAEGEARPLDPFLSLLPARLEDGARLAQVVEAHEGGRPGQGPLLGKAPVLGVEGAGPGRLHPEDG